MTQTIYLVMRTKGGKAILIVQSTDQTLLEHVQGEYPTHSVKFESLTKATAKQIAKQCNQQK